MSKKPLLPTGEVIKSWNREQIARFKRLQKDPAVWLGYWFSDKDGQSIYGNPLPVPAGPGVVHEADQAVLCQVGLHATRHLGKWGRSARRCWIVALSGDLQVGDDKACATRREILGEVLPEDRGENWRLRITMGEKDFRGVDLSGQDLRVAALWEADLSGANLQGADLSGANLRKANLTGADLQGADLSEARLYQANLTRANLTGANLTGADLRYAILDHTDLTGANFFRTNVYMALFHGVDLTKVDLTAAFY